MWTACDVDIVSEMFAVNLIIVVNLWIDSPFKYLHELEKKKQEEILSPNWPTMYEEKKWRYVD